jgi:hypothetical protein
VDLCSSQVLQLEVLERLRQPLKQAIIVCMVLVGLGCLFAVAIQMMLTYRHQTGFETRLRSVLNSQVETPILNNDSFREAVFRLQNPIKVRAFAHILPSDMDMKDRSRRLSWFCDYVCYAPAWIVMAVGMSGMMMAGIQLGAIHRIETDILPSAAMNFKTFAYTTVNDIQVKLSYLSEEFANHTNHAIDETETFFNDQAFGPIRNAISQFNTTVSESMDNTRRIVTETLVLQLFSPIIDRLWSCLSRSHLSRLQTIVELLNSLQISLPRVNMDLFVVNERRLKPQVDRLLVELFGNDFRGDNQQVSGGRIGDMIVRWRQDADFRFTSSLFVTVFGSLLLLQGLIGFLVSSF